MSLDRVSDICLVVAIAAWTLGSIWDFLRNRNAKTACGRWHLPPPYETMEESAAHDAALRAAGWKEQSPGVWEHPNPQRDPGSPF